MRVLVRTVVDTDDAKNIELSELSAFEKISVAFQVKYKQGKGYQQRLAKERAKEEREIAYQIDKLKEALLYRIHNTLNSDLKGNSSKKVPKKIIIAVDRSYRNIIGNVITSKEFLGFDIKVKREHPDMLLAFPALPIMLTVEKKVIKDEDSETSLE